MKYWFDKIKKDKLRKEEASLSLNVSLSEDSLRSILKVADDLKAFSESSQWGDLQKSWKSLEEVVEDKTNESIIVDFLNPALGSDYNRQDNGYYLQLLESAINDPFFHYTPSKTIFQYLIELEEEYARTQDYEVFEKICSTRLQIVDYLYNVYDSEYKQLQKRLRSTRLQLILVSYIENLRATFRKKVNYIYKKLDDEHELIISFSQ
ncbi:MAG TPA: hypothetical protein PK649_05235 [Vicingus sp.]|nr:hypothetical protein [Vicingus sp.]HRP58953.1 hypothetical protein [Vicingus sp.]